MDYFQTSGLLINILTMLVAVGSSCISYLVYKESTYPDVIVYLEQNNEVRTILNIVIKNIGKSAAKDVTFSFNENIFKDLLSNGECRALTGGALVSGIPFLAPGSCRILRLGNFADSKKILGDHKIRINTSFRKANSKNPFARNITNESYIELLSLSMVDASDNSNEKKIAENLAKIEKAILKIKKQH
ncbi:TPA: hypothetical protein ACKE7U_005012 [Klebsiella aerogenes]